MLDPFARLRKMKTMLIDDDVFIRDSMSILFAGEGCRLTALETAEEALEELGHEDYDIIITDYRLPGIDGLKFLDSIRHSHPQAMRILITAYGSQTITLDAVKLGARKIVEKPFTTETMVAALADVIAGSDEERRTPHHG